MADISEEELKKEIAAILEDADLSKTSVKKIRQELEKKLDCKLLSRKTEIDTMVMEFIENKKKDDDDEEEDEEEEEEDEDSDSEKKKKRSSSGKKTPAKKRKVQSKSRVKDDSEDDDSDVSEPSKEGDSEEEYSPKKSGKGKPFKTRKLPPKKKKGSESDSDEDWGKGKGKKKGAERGGGGFTKQLTLSKELAALVGQESMARHEVVKKMWAIIKERDLYDPKNKQFAICDDALFQVIGVKRFRTFSMMKYLEKHFSS